MGYYDQDQPNYNNQKGKKSGYFFSSLVGAIIGALIVTLFSNFSTQDDQSQEKMIGENGNVPTENVALNVETAVTKAVEKAGDAVVGITNIQTTNFWRTGETTSQPAGTGSGVVYKKEGGKAFIVTNHHVVADATELEVSLSDGTKIPAKLRGSDEWTDLAVLEVDAKNIKTVAELGNSDSLKVGEPVIAIGNPLGFTFSGSVTQGIISGLNRTIPIDINGDELPDWQAEVIQTDAAINPGNSGGALVNIEGQVIGINSMKIAQQSVEGIGLSIPINYARPIIDDLEKYGEMKRPSMGVSIQSVNEIPTFHQQETLKLPKDVDYGVAVLQVVPNSPAAKAGLQELDVIVDMDGEKITDVISLRQHLYNQKKIGDEMKVKYYRNGKLQETTMMLVGETF